MKTYMVTLGQNAREYTSITVEAENEDAAAVLAFAKAEAGECEWEFGSVDDGPDLIDVEEEESNR